MSQRASYPANRSQRASAATGIHVLRAFFAFATLSGATRSTDAATPTLPVPCVAISCGSTGPQSFVTSGTANAQQSGNTLTINNLTSSAILNWSSFNVGAGANVVFQQPSATAVALNRIFQASPSSIFGSVSANGQIYLVNPNGFIFGPNSTVNAASILASTLGISDAVFNEGILNPALLSGSTLTPALASDGRTNVLDNSGNPVLGANGQPIPVQLVVQQGAQLNSAGGGYVLLASQNSVQNAGTITSPQGQVILAAGSKVYLEAAPSTDTSLRGYIVEVDSGGTAWNQLTGSLSAPGGNVSMTGLVVNQDGRISATTTVSANGTVSLVAADTALSPANSTTGTIVPQHGGELELGPQSSIDILPDLSSTATAVAEQTQLQSAVTLIGQQIVMHSGAQIVAPGGTVTATAETNPSIGLVDGDPNAELRVDAGASIDVSGSTAQLPMSANVIPVQLDANELENDPLNANGFLHGQTVYVDIRADGGLGTNVANVTGAIQAITQNVAQRTENGGTVTLESEGDVVVAQGATINVSGGQTNYSGGVVSTTQLVASNGNTYNIGSASPNVTYVGLVNPTSTQTYSSWGVTATQSTAGSGTYEPAYIQGAPAGTVQVAAPNIVLNGNLLGTAYDGPYQRTAATLNPGGQLIIGLSTPLLSTGAVPVPDYLAPPVEFSNAPSNIVVADGASIPVQLTLDLPVTYLTTGGFTRTSIYSNDSITLPANLPLAIAPGGSLLLTAPRITIGSSISAPSGTLDFTTVDTVDDVGGSAPGREGIDLESGITLDVRGMWTNDYLDVGGPAAVGQTAQNGGSILLTLDGTDGALVLGSNVALEASGGAWLSATGSLTGGTGGTISLNAGVPGSALTLGQNVSLDAFGADGAAGGTFSLATDRIDILSGNTSASWSPVQTVDDLNAPGGVLRLYSSLFSQYGFGTIDLTATGPASAAGSNTVLAVEPGTDILAEESTLALNSGYLKQPTGSNIFAFSNVSLLPEYQRSSESITLAFAPATQTSPDLEGEISIGQGASVAVDPQGSISLASVGGIDIEGTLSAPAGTINAAINVYDPGNPTFVADQAIRVGPNALLDVSGTSIYTPNDAGLKFGSVLPGGSVSLVAGLGNVIAVQGSQINVSGTSAPLDVIAGTGAYALETVGSAGGSLDVASSESISLLGAINAAAGVGSTSRAAGGSLTVAMTASGFNGAGPEVVEVDNGLASADQSPFNSGFAVLSAPAIAASGAASLNLSAGYSPSTFVPTSATQSGAVILFDSGVSLALSEGLVLDAPTIAVFGGGKVSLQAPIVTFKNSGEFLNTSVATGGNGTLTVQASSLIDLVGSEVLQGIGNATLTSPGGDVRLDSTSYVDSSGNQEYVGGLTAGGNLTINAARVYPSTQASFTLASTGSTGSISLGQSGASPGEPLSAGGSVTIDAYNIVNSGSLYAPFGEITLTAGNALTLSPGSVTSVSGNGLLVPYGNVQNSTSWLYNLTSENQETIAGIPTRQVSLTAPSVTVAQGATVDLSGGGDLYAYEFIPGTGGLTDALANSGSTHLYAVLPSLVGQAAPYDPEAFASSGLTPGESVYLSGSAGLAAGVYPLLPARYALLPGAILVQELSGSQGTIAPGITAAMSNGTPEVAGYITYANTGLGAPLYSAFAVYPTGYAETLATYQNNYASTFFSAAASAAGLPTPALPADAGRLLISVASSGAAQPPVQSPLTLLGTVLTTPATGGTGADIEIGASDISIVANAAAVPAAGTTQLMGSVLQGFDAGQLLIGGERNADGSINVLADSISVGSGVTVSAQDLVMVAGSSIDVASGATVASTSGLTPSTAPKTLPAAVPVSLELAAGANAALLAVSETELPVGVRTGGAAGGTVTLEAGSTVESGGAVAIEGPGGISLSGTLGISGASVSLASSDIRFGSAPGSSGGLTIDTALLGTLQGAQAVRLDATGAIDVLTDTNLGTASGSSTPTLGSLTLVATAIDSPNAQTTATFGAQSLTLEGLGAGVGQATNGTGQLTFVADSATVEGGTLSLSGFGRTTLQIAGPVIGSGTAALAFGGDAAVTASTITGSNGAELTLSAPAGTLSLAIPSGGVAAATPGLGAVVNLSANVINDDGAITVPSGSASLVATSSLSVGPAATIDTAGTAVTAAGVTDDSPGGSIRLTSGGALTVSAGAAFSVSGAASADAGSISVSGAGTVSFEGSLAGVATSDARGGSFSLYAGQLAGSLDGLSSSLQAGGFTTNQSIEVASGNLVLDAGQSMTANQVQLVADAGSVQVGGTISAPSADLRGNIGLFAAQNVELLSTGQLNANSTGVRGGDIELGTTGGEVLLDSGSLVTATGSQNSGTLTLRAPAVGSSDVAVGSLSGVRLSGVGQVQVEPVLTTVLSTDPTSTTDIDAGEAATLHSLTASYIASAGGTIATRLGGTTTAPLVIEPAVDIQSAGNVSISDPLALSAWRFNGAPVDFTVQAAGSIDVQASITDGEQAGTLSGSLVPLAGASSSISLIAGANLASANPGATQASLSASSLTLEPGVIVTTGTGNISLASAGDIIFNGAGATAYTTGTAAASNVTLASRYTLSFLSQGGNLSVNAGGDIVGSSISQSVSDWQSREVTKAGVAEYGVDLNQFDQVGYNLASLGGGDVRIASGGGMTNLSAAAADSVAILNNQSTHFSSGGLVVQAGGDIDTGQFFLANGTGKISAGGSLASSENDGTGAPIGTLLTQGNSDLTVSARGDVLLEGDFNPTVIYQPNLPIKNQSGFFTYGTTGALDVTSISGDLSFNFNSTGIADLMGSDQTVGTTFFVQPPNLSASALAGNVIVSGDLGGLTLFPSSTSQLSVFAAQNIEAASAGNFIIMADPAAGTYPTLSDPSVIQNGNVFITGTGAIHVGDSVPVSIAAGDDISGLRLQLPKAAEITAGTDIVNLNFAGQNLASTDVTLISAGRDIVENPDQTDIGITLGGPGALDLFAGRNVNLGDSLGVTTTGALADANLPTSTGAAINIWAGLGIPADVNGFVTTIVAPSSALQSSLVSFMEGKTGAADLTYTQAQSEFLALPFVSQEPFVANAFFGQLLDSGLAASNPAIGYSQGYAAINALFPGSISTSGSSNPNPYSGDLQLPFSRIYSLSGGTISLLVPGGLVDVGLANPPANIGAKPPSDLGIVAEGAGDVDIYTSGDVNVNSSRIFTLLGGNILIWSNEGSIDAGQGAKTSISAPPPTVEVNAEGVVTLNFSGAVAGSGIRTIQTEPDVNAGNVDLIAPVGTINAGDAGIGAAGNLYVSAAHVVVGAGGFTAGGSETGVPPAVGGLSASLSGAASSASSATNASTNSVSNDNAASAAAAPLASSALSFLDVFVEGFGTEDCKPNDAECLKRNAKTPQ